MTDHPQESASPTENGWNELIGLLGAAETDPSARDRVIALLYPELKKIAEAQMRRERPDHTLQATGLVSEFFVHLARSTRFTAKSRAHFLVLASIVMRRLLVDYARARKRDKRGGELVRVDFDHADRGDAAHFVDLLEIDELLSQLAQSDERMAKIVELRFFGGLTNVEVAEALGRRSVRGPTCNSDESTGNGTVRVGAHTIGGPGLRCHPSGCERLRRSWALQSKRIELIQVVKRGPKFAPSLGISGGQALPGEQGATRERSCSSHGAVVDPVTLNARQAPKPVSGLRRRRFLRAEAK